MDGQWLGTLVSKDPAGDTSTGLAVVDLDNEPGEYRGSAFYFPSRSDFPATVAHPLVIPKDVESYRASVRLVPLDRTGLVLDEATFSRIFPGMAHALEATINLRRLEDGLEVRYETSLGSTGSGVLERARSDEPSILVPEPKIQCWADFKAFAAQQPPYAFIYRGQSCLNRLRTSFHRTRRTDLVRYINEDVRLLQRQLSPATTLRYREPEEVGAFYNLIQHHGYPTPLLDWSASPFIAAFFAFRDRGTPADSKVRILVFNREAWCRDYAQYDKLTHLPPHLSVIELLGTENKRMIPQQALSTITNVDDIETYIAVQERRAGKTYLSAIDLPVMERTGVLTELSMMGITAASLFPGLDGTCEAMKGRLFGH
jgi:hypothetical protein